jgi:hypothetical protein
VQLALEQGNVDERDVEKGTVRQGLAMTQR